MVTPNLRISKLTKRYGNFVALAPTDLDVVDGEFLTLLGPSGSGKTTLLSLIAGLSTADDGQVFIGGSDITYSAPYERDIGMVFQNYALFPHMTIAENIGFPLRMRKVGAEETRRRVADALEMVRLPHISTRYPRELSGGQQQRVALARATVYRPSIILMDEPLGALDKKLRDQMQLEIKRIHRELGATIVYVTHDQEEAMTMSDRIVLLNGGSIEQLGTPDDLYFRPRTVFVADFLGESNLLPGTVRDVSDGTLSVEIADGVVVPATRGEGFSKGQRVQVMVRPQNMTVRPQEAAESRLAGKLTDIMVSGSLTKLYMDPTVPGMPPLIAAYPTRSQSPHHEPGEILTLDWHPSDAVAIPDGKAA